MSPSADNGSRTILLVDDEPLILMDLEFAAEDAGLNCVTASRVAQALELIEQTDPGIDCAVLDVSLMDGETCLPIAKALDALGIRYVIHSGDLDRRNETIRSLTAPLIAKPASSDDVIAKALSLLDEETAEQG